RQCRVRLLPSATMCPAPTWIAGFRRAIPNRPRPADGTGLPKKVGSSSASSSGARWTSTSKRLARTPSTFSKRCAPTARSSFIAGRLPTRPAPTKIAGDGSGGARASRSRCSCHRCESWHRRGDRTGADAPARLFDFAESELGPVDILINNASGWLADTFVPAEPDRFNRNTAGVSAETFDRQFAVDARASAALIAEFARRHVARHAKWGRIIGLTSGGLNGFPGEVSYGAAKAALENYTMSAAYELAGLGITANIVH